MVELGDLKGMNEEILSGIHDVQIANSNCLSTCQDTIRKLDACKTEIDFLGEASRSNFTNTNLQLAEIQRSGLHVGNLDALFNQIHAATISSKDFQTHATKLQAIGTTIHDHLHQLFQLSSQQLTGKELRRVLDGRLERIGLELDTVERRMGRTLHQQECTSAQTHDLLEKVLRGLDDVKAREHGNLILMEALAKMAAQKDRIEKGNEVVADGLIKRLDKQPLQLNKIQHSLSSLDMNIGVGLNRESIANSLESVEGKLESLAASVIRLGNRMEELVSEMQKINSKSQVEISQPPQTTRRHFLPGSTILAIFMAGLGCFMFGVFGVPVAEATAERSS